MQISETVAKCQQGQLEAFSDLYDHFAQKIYAFLFHKTFHRELAEDLTSETFVKALNQIQRFDSNKGNFQAWLFTIARNNLTDYFRSSHPTKPIEDAWEIASEEDTKASAEIALLKSQLQKHMLQLSPESREILMMRFWQDLSFKEIASILSKSEGSVKMSVARSLKTLKQYFPLFLLFSFIR